MAKKWTKYYNARSLTPPLCLLPLLLKFAPYALSSLKPNKQPNNKKPNRHKTNESPAEWKDGRLRMQKTSLKRKQNKKWRSRHFAQVVSREWLRLSTHRASISAEELGTMSKNNSRDITLVRGPIRGIHSLTLIISWKNLLRQWNPLF